MLIFVCSFKASIFSPSALIFRRRLCSCDPPKAPLLARIPSAACSSRTVTYILRGKMQGVGRTYRCLKTRKTLRNFHRQSYQLWIENSKRRHGLGNLVGTPSQNRCHWVLTLTLCARFVVRPDCDSFRGLH